MKRSNQKSNHGIALIIVMSIAAIVLILATAFYIQSNAAVRTNLYEKGISLAETGSEMARGWAEEQAVLGNSLSQWTTSQTITSTTTPSAVPLSFETGGAVDFSSQALKVLGPSSLQAYGIPITIPVYSSTGSLIGTKTTGYSAFVMEAGSKIQVFALGAIGNSPNQIISVKELHVIIKPVSYTSFTYFQGDPSEPVAILDGSRDSITNQPLTSTCSPCTGDTLFSSGDTIPGGNSSLSFDKSYSAGQMVVLPSPSSNNALTGLGSSDYYFSLTNSQNAVYAGQNVYVPNGGNSGIWTGEQSIGLPTTSGKGSLTNVMQQLFSSAVTGGLFLYDPGGGRVSTSNTDWVPQNNWDPQNGWNSGDKVNVVVSNKNDQMTCSDGSQGDIKIELNGYWIAYYENGAGPYVLYGPGGTEGGYASHCFNSQTLEDHIVYVDGNMGIQSNWNGNTSNLTGGYEGNMSYVSPGRISLTGDLTSQSFLNDNSSVIQSGSVPSNYTFKSSSSDVSGLITPYQIAVNPSSPENFTNTMILEQLGSPSTLPWQWYDGSDIGSNFTINFSDSNIIHDCSTPCSNYNLYGTQIQYYRSSPPYQYYNNVYQPFDFNLLQSQPPYSPAYSAGYDVVYWEQVNRSTGQDMNYDNVP